MNKLKVVYKKVEDLIPYARNSRTHSDAQIAQIAASIKEFGWRTSILVDADNGIIAGHGRVLAARKLGLTELPTVDGSDMTETQKKAYVIADNKLALNAGWDEEILLLEFEELKNAEFDLSLTGFNDKELERFLKNSEDYVGENDDSNMSESYEIIVECISEFEQRTLLERLTSEGLKCKSLMR